MMHDRHDGPACSAGGEFHRRLIVNSVIEGSNVPCLRHLVNLTTIVHEEI